MVEILLVLLFITVRQKVWMIQVIHYGLSVALSNSIDILY